MSQLSQFNEASIITWNGIITMYGVIRNLAKITEVKFASLDEVKRYNERR